MSILDNKGQSLIGIIIVLVVVGLIGGGLYYYLQKQIPEIPEITEKPAEEEIIKPGEEEVVKSEEEEVVTPSPEEGLPEEEVTPKEEITPEITPACQNECSKVGLRGCSSNNSYQICGNYDTDNCLEWGPVISCSEGTRCVRGYCLVINSPKPGVEYWALVFSTTDYLSLVSKDILTRHGWKENHIKYFVGENVTHANIIGALDWLANNTDSNDIVLFHSITHGLNDRIQLADRFLAFSELAEKLDKIRYNGLVIIIEACYSGGAIPFLQREKRIVLTSARSHEVGVGAGFSQKILVALQGFGDIEGNNNAWVSVEEVFNFVKIRYPGPQFVPWPQIQDNYPGELDIVFLDGYWRYLDQYNISKTTGFTSSDSIGIDPLEGEVRLFAQSFKPNYSVLTKAMLGVYFGGGKPGPLTVSVRKDLSGSDLTSATLNQDIIRLASSQFYEFDFPDIAVVPNESYYLVIRAPYAVKRDDRYGIWIDTGGNYPKGEMFVQNNPPSPWINHPPFDLYFATFGKTK